MRNRFYLTETMDEARMLKEGWQKRSIAMEPRLGEMVDLYKQLGLEVLTEPTSYEDLPQQACLECYLVQLQLFRTIYTRARG